MNWLRKIWKSSWCKAVLIVALFFTLRDGLRLFHTGATTKSDANTPSPLATNVPVGRFDFENAIGYPHSIPLSELPKYLAAPEGSLTLVEDLFSDPMRAEDEVDKFVHGMPIYLINRTGKDVIVPHNGSDIYIKMELKDSNGHWVRCQPSRIGLGSCGRALEPLPPLRNDCFYKVYAYFPRVGKQGVIRYAIHSGDKSLFTEERQGCYSTDAFEMARFDGMALSEEGVEFVEDFLIGRSRPTLLIDDLQTLREHAFNQLTHGRFPADVAEPVLKRVRESDPSLHSFGLYEPAQGQLTFGVFDMSQAQLEAAHQSYRKRLAD